MKRVYYDSRLAKWILAHSTCTTIMLFSFILTKNTEEEMGITTLTHETIHTMQYAETTILAYLITALLTPLTLWLLLIPPFLYYILYGIEYLILLIVKRDTDTAYRTISYEKEAYDREKDETYPLSRPLFNNLKYL